MRRLGMIGAVALAASCRCAPARGGTLRTALPVPLGPVSIEPQPGTAWAEVEPLVLEPVESVTTVEPRGAELALTLVPGLVFHDHTCFTESMGRAARPGDLLYALSIFSVPARLEGEAVVIPAD